MKILYLTHSYAKDGSSTALLNILKQLKNIVQIYLISARSGYIINECKQMNIGCSVISMYEAIYPPLKSIKDLLLFFPRLVRMIFLNSRAKKKLKNIIIKESPDIIHTNTGVLHIGNAVANTLKIPHVWHIREYQDLDFGWLPFPSKKSFLSRISYPNNYPIAISQGVLKHHLLDSNVNATVIYDGVLPEKSVCFNPKKDHYFLFVGRLDEAKGIELLIDAYITFCQNDKKFILKIAGKGSPNYTKYLEKKVVDANLEDRILFLGFQSNVEDLMSMATAIIVPSKFEGFGFITVEAMFYGCLVIGNNSAGTKEILEKENLGILYSGKCELVEALISLVRNGVENYSQMLERAQKNAVSHYSQEQNAKSIYSLYKSILN